MKSENKQSSFLAIAPSIMMLMFALSITAFFYVFIGHYTDITYCLVVASIGLEFFFMPLTVLLCAGKGRKSAVIRSVISVLSGLAVMLPLTYLFNNILVIGNAESALIASSVAFVTVAVPFVMHLLRIKAEKTAVKVGTSIIAIISAAVMLISSIMLAFIPIFVGTYSTETVKIDNGDVQMIAHRGLSALEIENTCAAFTEAGKRSYFGIESDVHRTSDGEYVMIHDDDTGRVAKANIIVENSTLAELRAIVLNDKNGKKGREDLLIPTLSEYLAICKEYEKIAILELKPSFTPDEISEIVTITKENGYYENVVFISFDLQNLISLRKQYPDAKAQYLTGEYNDSLIDTLTENNLDVSIRYKELTKEAVDAFHNAGIEVNCWTCDNASKAQKLIGWGVDYITTNILE